ncbi:hypothetical protein MRX96_027033 [Rhipicephalus microplus]
MQKLRDAAVVVQTQKATKVLEPLICDTKSSSPPYVLRIKATQCGEKRPQRPYWKARAAKTAMHLTERVAPGYALADESPYNFLVTYPEVLCLGIVSPEDKPEDVLWLLACSDRRISPCFDFMRKA